MGFRLSLPRKPPSGELYDVFIIGAGPAGLSAALYSARLGLKAVVVGEEIGGALTDAGEVDDYPAVMAVQGPDLAKRFEEHVRKYGVPIVRDKVVKVFKEGNEYRVSLLDGVTYRAKTVIVAVGSRRRKLGVPGEDEFSGRGVSYCAPCDAPLFKGKKVAVVGGGNAALQAALLLTVYSPRVYLIHRRDEFKAFPIYVKKVVSHPRIVRIMNSEIKRVGGGKSVEWVEILDKRSNSLRRLDVEGVIVEIGSEPPRDFLKEIGLKLDEKGYVIIGPGQETNLPGVYAAGDCTAGPHKKKFDQVVTAAAEGAIAALSAYEYITLGREIKESEMQY